MLRSYIDKRKEAVIMKCKINSSPGLEHCNSLDTALIKVK